MKLINDDEDLFLHDFSNTRSEEKEPRGTEVSATREFSFTSGPAAAPQSSGRRRRRGCSLLVWTTVIALIAGGIAFYIRYFIPHTSESKTRGYVTVVEKRGIIFKTFEGEMVSETRLSDTTRVYSRDFQFSIPDDSLGRLLQGFQSTGRPVEITTKKYYGTLPWRGATNTILTDIRPQ